MAETCDSIAHKPREGRGVEGSGGERARRYVLLAFAGEVLWISRIGVMFIA